MPLRCYQICVFRLAIDWRSFVAIAQALTALGSTTNGEFVFAGPMRGQKTSRLWTTTKE
jgi:hypothetical protein